MKRVAIIGGGVSGLACAHRLAELAKEKKEALEILLFESSSRAGGGIVQTEKREGFLLERGPDSFLSEKSSVSDLSKRLGIDSKIINTEDQNRKVFVARGGRLIGLPAGFYLIAPTDLWAFFQSPLFSLPGKLRMAAEWCVPRKKSDGDESVGSFIRRRFGKEALDRVGQPMVAGVYSGDPESLSLSETMPRFINLEEKHGSVIRGLIHESKTGGEKLKNVSGPRYSLFLSYLEGMETLTQAIASHLPAGSLRVGEEITEIIHEPGSSSWKLVDKKGAVFTADALCVTVPAHKASTLFRKSAPQLSDHLGKIPYQSIATINFAYKEEDIAHALDGFGFVVPATEKSSIIACTFSSKKFINRAPKGCVLLRAFVGGFFGGQYFNREDADLVNTAAKDLAQLLGIKGKPLFSLLTRYPKSMAQYEVGHGALTGKIETELKKYPGLFVSGAAYHGTGIPDCVLDAEFRTEEILSYLDGVGR